MPLTFRARLTIWYVATFGLLLALTAAGLIYAMGRVAQKKFDAALWMVGATEAENVVARLRARGVERPDAETVSDTRYRELLGYGGGPLEKYVTVVDDAGRAADYTTNLSAPLPVDGDLLKRALAGEPVYGTVEAPGAGRLRVVYMPVGGDALPHPLVVMVGLPERFVAGEVRSFNLMVALALVTIILLTAASASLLAERAIRPLEKIAAAAEAVNARNLKARLPEPDTHDQLRRLVSVFNGMLARLDSAFEAQHHFSSRAAHELRTPLTILKGEAQVALGRRRTVEEYESLLRSSLEEVDKLVEIIDDMLLLARYEGGETDIPREPVALHEIVRAVAGQLQSIASHRGLELSLEVEEHTVQGEPKALERLVCKLLENVVFYAPRGGRVRVRLAREGADQPDGGGHRHRARARGTRTHLRPLLPLPGRTRDAAGGLGHRPGDGGHHRAPARRDHRSERREGRGCAFRRRLPPLTLLRRGRGSDAGCRVLRVRQEVEEARSCSTAPRERIREERHEGGRSGRRHDRPPGRPDLSGSTMKISGRG
jgi:signal transduction histidine kinase